jgi:hypothetical protein
MTDATAVSIHDARYCGGKKRQGEGTCTQPAGWGTPHPGAGRCKLHGGCAPSGVKAGEAALVEKRTRELFGKIAPERKPIDNPLAAYAEFAGRVMAWLDAMDMQLDELRTVGYESERVGEQIHAAIQLYERAMDRANTVLSSYARLNIDDRLAGITRQQAEQVVRALDAVIVFLGATGPRAIEARKVGAQHLRLIANGG